MKAFPLSCQQDFFLSISLFLWVVEALCRDAVVSLLQAQEALRVHYADVAQHSELLKRQHLLALGKKKVAPSCGTKVSPHPCARYHF